MMKRIVCALLALMLLFSLVPVTSVTASAASVSKDLVNFVKNEEFYEDPEAEPVEEFFCYQDNGQQQSIGFGTVCPGGSKLHDEGEHSITRAEAEAALKKELEAAADAVNKFAAKYGLSLSQSQFEALVSFSYNCGTGWMSADGIFRQAVIDGKKGNDFLYAITLWSSGGVGLRYRRLKEANMYLNGKYSNTVPAKYTYVLLDPAEGTMNYTIQAYNIEDPTTVVETPTRKGYKFLGWYNEEGQWVTTLNEDTAYTTLTAKWQKAVGGGTASGEIVGTEVNYEMSGKMATDLNIYKLPGTGAAVLGKIKKTDTLLVEAEYIDSDNVKWVKITEKLVSKEWATLEESGWICVGDVKNPAVQNSNLIVKVTNAYINVRKEPSASATSKIVGKVYLNEELRITEIKEVKKALWGKCEKGWIALQYTNYEEVTDKEPVNKEDEDGIITDGTDKVIATGTVSVSNYVYVRKGPGVNYDEVNKVNDGTKVTIFQIEKVDAAQWGRINTGWICLVNGKDTYVEMDAPVEAPEDSDAKIIATGYVNSTSNLSVREGAGVSKKLVKTLASGTSINVYETKKVNGHTWGKIDPVKEQWVCLTYVSLLESEEINGEGTKGTIVNCSAGANIRSDAGIGNALVGVAPVGSTVMVYQQKTVNGSKWGRIDKGWVCMDYVLLEGTVPGTGDTTPDADGTTPDSGSTAPAVVIMTGSITGDTVYMYAEPTTKSENMGLVMKGSVVSITELKLQDGTSRIWGKAGDGWVNMAYVKINAVPAVVNTKTGGKLNVRDGSCDTSVAAVAKLDNGAQVTITKIKAVNGGIWGQIDAEKDHWISLSLVVLNSTAGSAPAPEQKPDNNQNQTPSTTPDTTVKTGVIANTNSVNVRKAPGVGNALVTTLTRGTKVTIYEQVTKDNAPWARIGENQWVAMVYIALDPVSGGTTGGTVGGTTGGTSTGTGHATGIVNSNVNLNVRTGPGTNYPQVAALANGTKVTVYEQKVAQGMTWGRIGTNQWVSLNYVTMTGTGSTGSGVMGTIARCYYAVNVRSAPGVGNALVGTIMVGSRVEVFEQKAYGGVNWGRVNQGWISMEYVLLDSELPQGGIPGMDNNGSGTGSAPEQKPETNPDVNLVIGVANGTVNGGSKDYANVYEEPGSKGVATLVNGTKVTVTELKAKDDKVWGKIATGWISMSSVDEVIPAVVKTKTGGQLNVRDSSCDTSVAAVAKLDNGSQVSIVKTKVVNGGIWGLINAEKDHWISLSLVTLNATAKPSTGNGNTNTGNTNTNTGNTIGNNIVANGSVLYTGTIVGTVDGVRIRSTPSTTSTELGKLKNGTGVVIYDVAVAEYMAWGKCDAGWVCLTYVDLKPMKEGAVDTRVVWHENLAIRADAGLNYEQLASYAKCTVVDIYETRGNWGRTVDGWVCLDYLLP